MKRRFADRDLQTQRGRSQAYLADVLSRLVNRHPASQIDQLMPWAYANQVALKTALTARQDHATDFTRRNLASGPPSSSGRIRTTAPPSATSVIPVRHGRGRGGRLVCPCSR
jgi:hypothetical protein